VTGDDGCCPPHRYDGSAMPLPPLSPCGAVLAMKMLPTDNLTACTLLRRLQPVSWSRAFFVVVVVVVDVVLLSPLSSSFD